MGEMMAAIAAQEIGLEALRDFWNRTLTGAQPADAAAAWVRDETLLCGLGLNLLETLRYLNAARPSYAAFEAWIRERNGDWLDAPKLERLRRALAGERVGPPVDLEGAEGLSAKDLAHWDEHGYCVLRGAVPEADAEAAELAIYAHLGMDRDDPESWYRETLGPSIWVPLLRDPAMQKNRRSARIVKAFAQLWGRDDLWMNVDQGGLNPPERPGWPFPGPHVHWDTTLAPPHYFGVQGILYLVDVAEDQGAFRCVPGFHKTLQAWLDALPAEVDPRVEARRSLTMQPVAGKRGDLVLWHPSLPHGSSPNRAARPRVAQYMTMHPTEWQYNAEWR